jgi:hypothetical protein
VGNEGAEGTAEELQQQQKNNSGNAGENFIEGSVGRVKVMQQQVHNYKAQQGKK